MNCWSPLSRAHWPTTEEVARVDHGEPARQVAVAAAEHRDGDDVAGMQWTACGFERPKL
jgi:hypothetical protein